MIYSAKPPHGRQSPFAQRFICRFPIQNERRRSFSVNVVVFLANRISHYVYLLLFFFVIHCFFSATTILTDITPTVNTDCNIISLYAIVECPFGKIKKPSVGRLKINSFRKVQKNNLCSVSFRRCRSAAVRCISLSKGRRAPFLFSPFRRVRQTVLFRARTRCLRFADGRTERL